MFRLKVKPCIQQDRDTTSRYKIYASSELNERRESGKPLPHAFVFHDKENGTTYWVPESELGKSSMSMTMVSPHEQTNRGGSEPNFAQDYTLDVQMETLVDDESL
jgi:hypothetical protein